MFLGLFSAVLTALLTAYFLDFKFDIILINNNTIGKFFPAKTDFHCACSPLLFANGFGLGNVGQVRHLVTSLVERVSMLV